MQALNEFGRHGIQSLWAIQSNHEDSWDRSFEDDDWCRRLDGAHTDILPTRTMPLLVLSA